MTIHLESDYCAFIYEEWITAHRFRFRLRNRLYFVSSNYFLLVVILSPQIICRNLKPNLDQDWGTNIIPCIESTFRFKVPMFAQGCRSFWTDRSPLIPRLMDRDVTFLKLSQQKNKFCLGNNKDGHKWWKLKSESRRQCKSDITMWCDPILHFYPPNFHSFPPGLRLF